MYLLLTLFLQIAMNRWLSILCAGENESKQFLQVFLFIILFIHTLIEMFPMEPNVADEVETLYQVNFALTCFVGHFHTCQPVHHI